MNDNMGADIELSDDQNFLSRDILIVDDEIANLKLLAELLTQQGYQVRPTENPQLAIDSAFDQPPSLILLDVKMPLIDGFEVCRRLKQDARTKDIPVIFISALQSTDDKVRGFQAGGVDFITKPIEKEDDSVQGSHPYGIAPHAAELGDACAQAQQGACPKRSQISRPGG